MGTNNKMKLNKILEDMNENNLLDAKYFLHTTRYENNGTPLNILITICKLTKKEGVNINFQDLFDTTQLCCTTLTNLNDSEVEKLLLAMYHIIKYCCINKTPMNYIVNLCDYVKQLSVDAKFGSTMYGFFVRLFHNEFLVDGNVDNKILSNIVLLSLEMQTLDPNYEPKAFFKRLKLYIALFKGSKIGIEQRHSFCLKLLSFLDNIQIESSKEITSELYQSLLTTMNIIISDISSLNIHKFPCCITTNLKFTFQLMRKLENKDLNDCINLLEIVSKAIIKDLKKRQTKHDIQKLVEANQILEVFVQKSASNVVIQTCIGLANTLRVLMDYFMNCQTSWVNQLKCEMLIELVNMFDLLGRILSKNVIETSQTNCLVMAASVTYYAGNVILVTSRLKMQIPEELHTLSLQSIENSCIYLSQLKRVNSNITTNIWPQIGVVLYNIAATFYKSENYECSCLYSKLLTKYLFIFEGVEPTSSCFDNALGTSLNLYATCCLNLGHNKEAFIYFALSILVCPVYRRKSLHSWIHLKSIMNDSEPLKTITINHILKMDEIKTIYPHYKYDETKVEPLLMQEFQSYIDLWPSKPSLNNCCTEICSISHNIINLTKVFVLSWDKVLQSADTIYGTNLEKAIAIAKSTDDLSDIICLSLLTFVLYQYRTIVVMNKNLQDMQQSELPLKSIPLQPYEEPPNPNDKCDIVPAYYSMNIENLVPIHEILNNCLDLWNKILNYEDTETIITLGNKLNMGEIIKLTAFEFRLQYFQYQMLKTWTLYLKFGKLFNNKEAIVTSIGFILEYSDFDTKLEIEAENIISQLELDTNQLNTIITYYINKSSSYLRNDHYEKGYKEMCIAEKYAKDFSEIDKIVEARLMYLKSGYLLLPCNEGIMPHDDNFLVTMQHAYTIIAEYYKKSGGRNSYLLSTVLEISLADGWLYKQLRLPREARCYTKDGILLSQKYLLPIKTAQFLSLLAFVDLLDGQYDDCDVKLNGLTRVLSYGSGRTIKHAKIEMNIKPTNNTQFDTLGPIFQSVLDVPHRAKSTIHGSPELTRKPFAVPEFMKHFQSCVCYKCINIEYQKLILDSIQLEALLNSYQNKNEHANDYFHGGYLLYEQIRKRTNSFSGVNLISDKITLKIGLYKNLAISYCEFMLDISYFFVKTNLTEANNVLKKLLEFVEDGNKINNFLSIEIFVQQLNLYDLNELAAKPKSVQVRNELNVVSDTILLRTPENKISIPKIVFDLSPCVNPKPGKSVKKIVFDLLDSDESEIDKPKTPVPNKNLYFKLQTPAKTPAAKVRIYTPKTVHVKKTRKCSNTTNKLDMTASIKTSRTPTTKQLEQRTRLLTEKLKSEKIGVLTECNSSEVLDVQKPESLKDNVRKSKKVQKHLLGDMVCNNSEVKPKFKENAQKTNMVERNIRKILQDDLDNVIDEVSNLTISFKRASRSTKETKMSTVENAKKTVRKPRKMILDSSGSSDDSGVRRSTRNRKC